MDRQHDEPGGPEPRPAPAEPRPSGTPLADRLETLLGLVTGSDIELLEVEHDGVRFVIRREPSDERASATVAAPPPEPVVRDTSFVVTAPVVGVFRRTDGRSADIALDPGDVVTAGQVVGAVEAMGMLNRVQAERPGLVLEVLVREGQPVEYGQPLLVIREP